MSIFLPLRRATLLVPSGSRDDPRKKHLFILLTDPCDYGEGDEKHALMVSLSRIKEHVPHDASCVLYPGDHPFIQRKSYVVYQRARIESADKLLRGVDGGQLVPQQPMDGAIFARICKGLEESRFTAPNMLDFYRSANTRAGEYGRG